MSSNILSAESSHESSGTRGYYEGGVAVLESPSIGEASFGGASVELEYGADAATAVATSAEMIQWTPVWKGRMHTDWSTTGRDLIQLTKPRIVVMILVTTVATAMIAAGGSVAPLPMLLLLLGTGLVAGSAGGANQIWERVIDRSMPRTASRPLPAERVSIELATAFTGSIGTLGVAVLWIGFGLVPAMVGLTTWVLYVFLYTPMKTRTSWNTTVGAVSGALPMLIGYTALGGSLGDAVGWLLFGVLAAWQYPHFMAIAWLYRRQYDEAGFQMSTTVEPTGISAAVQSIAGSIAVIGCGVALCLWTPGVVPAVAGSLAVSAATLPMLKASIRFARQRNDATARQLLRSSLLVLPAVLAVVTIRVFW